MPVPEMGPAFLFSGSQVDVDTKVRGRQALGFELDLSGSAWTLKGVDNRAIGYVLA